jgi:hypothetical protein
LTRWVHELLREPARRNAIGQAAFGAIQRHSDLPARTADTLLTLLDARSPPCLAGKGRGEGARCPVPTL